MTPTSGLGAPSGVYVFNSDTFVPISSTPTDAGLSNVKALAWMPDGQSYFASGDQLVNYSTCNDQNPQSPCTPINLTSRLMDGLSATALSGVPHAARSQWQPVVRLFRDTTARSDSNGCATQQSRAPGKGDVCLSTVTVNAPVTTASTLLCTAAADHFFADAGTGIHHRSGSFLRTPRSRSFTATTWLPSTEILPSTTAAPVDIPLSGGVLNDGRKLYFGTYDTTARPHSCIASIYQPARARRARSRKTFPLPLHWSPASSRLSLSKRRDF